MNTYIDNVNIIVSVNVSDTSLSEERQREGVVHRDSASAGDECLGSFYGGKYL
jgi:hypothetical protein